MHTIRVHVPLNQAQEWIRDGDLLLFRRRGLIAAVGRGEHSHAALAGWWGETLCCLEVRALCGGRVVTLASQVNRYPGQIDVYQADPDNRWPEFDRQQTVQFMLRYAGERYGYGGILRVAQYHIPLLRLICRPKLHDEVWTLSRPFCSQACVTATRIGGGVDPVPQLADEATEPADLARSPFYRYRATLVPDDEPAGCPPRNTPTRRSRGIRSWMGVLLGALLVIAICPGGRQRAAIAQGCPQGFCPVTPYQSGTDISQGIGAGTFANLPNGSLPTNSLARIENKLATGIAVYGSGVLIHKDERWGWLLTCDHLFREGVGRLTVWLPGSSGFSTYEARLVARSAPDDLAVVGIASPPNPTAAIAETVPRPGDVVALAGFGPHGSLRVAQGTVLGYVQTAGSSGVETLQIRAAARDGDSGGPILDNAGRVVAILWGTDGYRTVGTYCGRIRQFLAGIFGDQRPIPRSPENPLVPIPPQEAAPSPSGPPEKSIAGSQSPTDSPLAQLHARLEDLRQRLEARLAGDESLSERLRQLEERTSLVSELRQRVEHAEQVVGAENIRAVIRQTAADLLAEKGPGWLDTILPAVLTALGWTGPPSIALAFAARLGLRILERRLRQRVAEALSSEKSTATNAKSDQNSLPSN
ncbi:trypsin-like peptidase domain-containing protein [Thermogutta sp.]|uniref:S1 family peptidase n=1 Tax=Thermogutta sp. TaxID=1962930 RepID=UPI003C7B0D2C